MASSQKSRLLFLRNYLVKYTDEEHPLSRNELEQILKENGFTCTRKTFYDDLEAITESGVDIEIIRDGTGSVKYYVANREFQLSEVKLLIDAVCCSRFLTLKKTESLIEKLETLVSVYQSDSLNRQVFVKNRIKSMNETIYYAIDAIHSAINTDHAVTFGYFRWSINNDGTPVREFRHGGKRYTVSPWGVCWSDGSYYMIGFDHDAGSVKHFRVDRMRTVECAELERIRNEEFERFNIESYSSHVFGMFGGEEVYVEMRVPNELADVFIDKFGHGANIKRSDEEHFIVGADVVVSRQFFAWLLGLSERVSIVSPHETVEAMRKFIENMED